MHVVESVMSGPGGSSVTLIFQRQAGGGQQRAVVASLTRSADAQNASRDARAQVSATQHETWISDGLAGGAGGTDGREERERARKAGLFPSGAKWQSSQTALSETEGWKVSHR